MATDLPERTLAVLFGPQGPLHRAEISEYLLQAGFSIVAETEVVGEELEEAGLELGLGTGGEEGEEGVDGEMLHVALVLDRVSAVRAWKELLGEGAGALNSRSIATLYPTLKVHGSPSASAASMSISTLFPNLTSTTSSSPGSPSSDPDASFASEASPSHASIQPKPFALSNLALPSPQPLANKVLSPSIQRALAKLENEEEQKRLGSASVGSPDSTPPSVEDPSRRDFTFRSREPTAEDVEDELEQEYETDEEPAAAYDDEYIDEEVEVLSAPAALQNAPRERVVSTSTTSTSPSSFRARPAPSFNTSSPQPRLTKAAALRLGIAVPPRAPRPSSPTKSTPRAPVATPKSLAAPSIAPRSTKSSSLRTGEAPATPAMKVRREAAGTAERNANPVFENTPGFKRRESIQVASTARPKIEVRMTKGAALRAGIEVPPSLKRVDSTSSMGSEGPKRRESIVVKSMAPPKITPRGTKASALRAGTESPSVGRTPLEMLAEEGGAKRRESSQVASSARPAIEPRMTKSAMLRAGLEAPPRRTSTIPASFDGVPGHRRRDPIPVASSRPPAIIPPLTRTTLLRQFSDPLSVPRCSSVLSRPTTLAPSPSPRAASALSSHSAPARPPVITPRSNRSAELRAAKKVAETAVLEKVARKKVPARIGTSKALVELTPNGGDSPRGSPLRSGFGENVRSDGAVKDGQ